MQELWDFHRWLVGRVRADFPKLHIVALIAGEPEYRAAGYVLDKTLRDRFGAAADKAIAVQEMRRTLREYDSIAHKVFHVMRPGGADCVGIAEVNLHQAQLLHATGSPHHAKATLAHEIAHLLAGYHYPDHGPWLPLYEETAADLFEVAVMAVRGVTDHHAHLIFRRLRTRFNDAALCMSGSYGYAAIAAEGRALADKYAGVDPAAFSPAALRREVNDIVWRHRDRLKEWEACVQAAHKAGAGHRRAGAAVLRELSPEHPIAHDIAALAAFAPTDADVIAPDKTLRLQRYEAERAAMPGLGIAPHYYIAVNTDIVDGTWPQRNLAGKPSVR